MPEQIRAVIRDNTVINMIVIADDVLDQWRRGTTITDLFGTGARLIDIAGITPAPAIGWGYDGMSFTAPAGSPSTTGPREEETVIGTVKNPDPLIVTLPGYGDQPAQRHGGYTPMPGDRVQVTYTSGHWVVQDKVL